MYIAPVIHNYYTLIFILTGIRGWFYKKDADPLMSELNIMEKVEYINSEKREDEEDTDWVNMDVNYIEKTGRPTSTCMCT